MQVTDALVTKLADLARLEFNDEEKVQITKDLQQMITFVDKLNELDLSDVKPLLHMSDEVNVLRDDQVQGMISREEAFLNAPTHDDKFFIVPKVIKKQG